MSRIGIIDADLLGRDYYNFPNLALMKISGFHKSKGDEVRLVTYEDIDPSALFFETFDKVYLSRIYTDTPIPDNILNLDFLVHGGTGFYLDKAPDLPEEIEHSRPDYDLYNPFVKAKLKQGVPRVSLKYFTDFSIGFTSRGCFRKCDFCVNKKYDRVKLHSPVEEFFDPDRPKICLLDDNIFGCGKWRDIFEELIKTGRPFQFNQGLDIRLLNEPRAETLSRCKYEGRFHFAFDNINDKDIILDKLKIFKKYFPDREPKLYIFTGRDPSGVYDLKFWRQNLIDLLERIRLLMEAGALGYVMRFETLKDDKYFNIYTYAVNRFVLPWCNAPQLYSKTSIFEYLSTKKEQLKFYFKFEANEPEIAEKYFNLKYSDLNKTIKK